MVGFSHVNRFRSRVWKCKCDCGNTTFVVTNSLNTGNTKSCGCISAELTSQRMRVHGLSNTRLYQIWSSMIGRCHNPNTPSFGQYGAQGIQVCAEWRNSVQAFCDWAMANGYQDHLTIDRYPNRNGNYEPNNCRWATYDEQAQNRSNTKLTEEDVLRIRADDRPVNVIASDYGITQVHLSQIKKKETWKNI